MQRFPSMAAWFVVAVAAVLASNAASAAKLPETWDGLVQRKVKGIDAVYVRPDVDFSVYRNIVLDPVQVAFDKNWKPNRVGSASARLSTSDIERIRGRDGDRVPRHLRRGTRRRRLRHRRKAAGRHAAA